MAIQCAGTLHFDVCGGNEASVQVCRAKSACSEEASKDVQRRAF